MLVTFLGYFCWTLWSCMSVYFVRTFFIFFDEILHKLSDNKIWHDLLLIANFRYIGSIWGKFPCVLKKSIFSHDNNIVLILTKLKNYVRSPSAWGHFRVFLAHSLICCSNNREPFSILKGFFVHCFFYLKN